MKDQKLGKKIGHYSVHQASPTLDFPSDWRPMALEWAKLGKQDPKGALKMAGSRMSLKRGLMSCLASGFDSTAAVSDIDQMIGDDDADQNCSQVHAMNKDGAFKLIKKHGRLRDDQYVSHSSTGLSLSLKNDLNAYGEYKTVEPSNLKISRGYIKKVKYSENADQFTIKDQMTRTKGWAPNLLLKGSQIELSDGDDSFWHEKVQGEALNLDHNVKSEKRSIGKKSPDLIKDGSFHSEYIAEPSQEKVRAIYAYNGLRDMAALKGIRMLSKSEETESDSSDQIDEDEDDNPLMRQLVYHSGVLGSHKCPDPVKAKSFKKDKKNGSWSLDGLSRSSRKIAALDEHLLVPEVEKYPLKANQKAKMQPSGPLHNSASKYFEDSYFAKLVKLNGDNDGQKIYKLGMASGQGNMVRSSGYPHERLTFHREGGEGKLSMSALSVSQLACVIISLMHWTVQLININQ